MSPAFARLWMRLIGGSVAAWPGRDDILRLRPATRGLLVGLCGWAVSVVVVSAAVMLWPAATSAPGETFLAVGPRAPGTPRMDVAITQRPLFARTRRAAAEPVPIEAAPPPTRDRTVSLKGVFINGSDARAFLASGTEPEGRWVATNETIAGWTIAALTADEVRLTADDESLTISLHPAQGADAMPPRAATPLLSPGPWSPAPLAPVANAAPTEQRPMVSNSPSDGVAAPGLLGLRPRSTATP